MLSYRQLYNQKKNSQIDVIMNLISQINNNKKNARITINFTTYVLQYD